MTQPLLRATRAVVSPTPPGHEPGSLEGSIWGKRLKLPLGAICTSVVPVPRRFALLLKLLISVSPATRSPVEVGTVTMPYGLTSPLLGTVDATVLIVCRGPMNELPAALALACATTSEAVAPAPNSAQPDRLLISVLLLPVFEPASARYEYSPGLRPISGQRPTLTNRHKRRSCVDGFL